MNFIIRYMAGTLFVLVNIFWASAQSASYERYINTYKQLAIEQERKYNIPASIKLAQAILESGGGTSYLAREANNHFGIKCKSEWTGARAYINAEIPNECFRKYNSIADSYEDHSRFLTERSYYERLFKLKKTDYKGWAKGLQECGYATDKAYSSKLIKIIETYQLYTYTSDKIQTGNIQTEPVKTTPATIPVTTSTIALHSHDIYKTNGLLYVIALSNDSLEEIAKALGFKAKDLAKYNEIPVNFPIRQGDIIYLEMKKKMAAAPNYYHTVKVGESMHAISQRYGAQVNSLYKINNRHEDYIPLEGDVLKLR